MSDEVNAEVSTESSEPVKEFTQADVDRVVADRLARERKKFADYDELKAKVEESRSEQEKALDEARSAGFKEASERFQAKLFESEVKSAATRLRFHSGDDALSVFGDREGLIDADGSVDVSKVEARLKEIASSKPYLVEAAPTVAQRPTRRRAVPNESKAAPKMSAADLLREYARGR